jgi:hypothetical protein
VTELPPGEPTASPVRLLAPVAALLLALTACTAAAPPQPAVAPSATAQLADLTVVARPGTDPTNRRAAFGPAWVDVDHNSCRQRADALYRDVDRTAPYRLRTRGACPHEPAAGTWTDPYTGRRLVLTGLTDPVQARSIPVDHQ